MASTSSFSIPVKSPNTKSMRTGQPFARLDAGSVDAHLVVHLEAPELLISAQRCRITKLVSIEQDQRDDGPGRRDPVGETRSA